MGRTKHLVDQLALHFPERTGFELPSHLSSSERQPRYTMVHGVPIVIVDPHNEVFYFWALARRNLDEPAMLMHTDDHSDTAPTGLPFFEEYAGKKIGEASSEQLWDYTQRLTISDFIEAAVVADLIQPDVVWFNPRSEYYQGQLVQYRHQAPDRYALEKVGEENIQRGQRPKNPFLNSSPAIWDIDLDQFSGCHPRFPEVPFYGRMKVDEHVQRTTDFLRHCARPVLVTIAESQTPHMYCPPVDLKYVTEKTFAMLDEVLR